MIPAHLHAYVTALRAFAKVVKGCFSVTVSPTIKADIASFKEAYLKLNINVRPKFHIIFAHIPQYLDHKAAINDNTGLGIETAQPFEAIHHDFTKRWNMFKVNRENKAKYKSSFLRAVSCHVSLNVNT